MRGLENWRTLIESELQMLPASAATTRSWNDRATMSEGAQEKPALDVKLQ
jgi:hypothetical protein